MNQEQITEMFSRIAGTQAQTTAALSQETNLLEKLLKIEKKQTQEDQKDKKKEAAHKARLAQLAKRKEQDKGEKGKGPFAALFGNNTERKKDENNLSKLLLAGLGLLTAGAAWLMSDDPNAKKIREDLQKFIMNAINKIKEEIEKAIKQAVNDIIAQLNAFAANASKEAGITDAQESQTDKAPGTILEKIQQLNEEIAQGEQADPFTKFGEFLTGTQAERKEQLYYLESGETMSYAPDYRRGGSAGARGRGLVSGDVTDVINYGTGLNESDKQVLEQLDDMIRDRRSLNDQIAGMNKNDPDLAEVKEKLKEKDDMIGDLLDKNKALLARLIKERDERFERINQGNLNPEKKQTGGIVDVPGSGSGDKVPMMLSPGSFVLNREASKLFPGFQSGGKVSSGSVNTNPQFVTNRTGDTNPQFVTNAKPEPRFALEIVEKRVKGGEIPQSEAGGARAQSASVKPGPAVVAMSSASGDAQSIVKGAEKTIGRGRGKDYQCAETTRAALRAGGSGMAGKVTKKGDLDVPKGGPWTKNKLAAASFAGTDMGKVKKSVGALSPGDVVLWKNTFKAMGGDVPGAITHVGIKGNGNDVYDHSQKEGFRKRAMWDKGHFQYGITLKRLTPANAKGGYRNPATAQTGGKISATGTQNARFKEAQSQFAASISANIQPKKVIVRSSPSMQAPPPPQVANEVPLSFNSGGVNIVEMSSQLHRITAGESY